MRHTKRRPENSTDSALAAKRCAILARFLLGVAAFAIVAVGCGQPKPIRYYEISYPPVSPARQDQLNATLLVRTFFTSHLYREDRIVYGSNSLQMGTYLNERWSEPPAEMLRDALVRGLRSTGRFRSVSALRTDASGDFVLTGHLYDFKEVSGNGVVARINFDAELRDLKSGKTVWMHTYNYDEPSTGKDVASLVAAVDRNVQRSVQEVVEGIQQALAGYPLK